MAATRIIVSKAQGGKLPAGNTKKNLEAIKKIFRQVSKAEWNTNNRTSKACYARYQEISLH